MTLLNAVLNSLLYSIEPVGQTQDGLYSTYTIHTQQTSVHHQENLLNKQKSAPLTTLVHFVHQQLYKDGL